MQQTEIDDLIATNRRQADRIEALTQEAEDLRERLSDARALLFALRQLLAVIYSFTKLPLPVKADWQDYYAEGAKRLTQIGYAANELQGANASVDNAERWAGVLEALAHTPLSYEPEPGALPKPKPVDLGAEAAAGQ